MIIYYKIKARKRCAIGRAYYIIDSDKINPRRLPNRHHYSEAAWSAKVEELLLLEIYKKYENVMLIQFTPHVDTLRFTDAENLHNKGYPVE